METEKKQSLFLPALAEEVYKKILRVKKISSRFKVWAKGIPAIEFLLDKEGLIEIKKDGLFIAQVEVELKLKLGFKVGPERFENLKSLDRDDYFITFETMGVHYFGKGKVFDELIFYDFYKVDKRKEERLLLYPHYEGSLVFRGEKWQKTDNVIPMKRTETDDLNKMINFESDYFSKKLNRKCDFKTHFYHEFKLIDISEGGLSFLVSRKEKKILEKIKDNTLDKYWIIINQTPFEMERLKLLHFIDFKASKFSGLKLFKLGGSFLKKSDELIYYIKNYLNKEYSEELFKDEFEKIFES